MKKQNLFGEMVKKQEQKPLYLQQIKHLYFTATSQKSQKA